MGDCVDNICVCKKGFNHDLTFVRFRNCALPDHLMLILFLILLLLTVRVFYVTYKQYSTSKSMARIILTANLVSTFGFFIFVILQISFNFIMNGISIIFFISYSIGASLVMTLNIYSLIAPLYSVARKDPTFAARTLAIQLVFSKMAQAIPLLIAVGLYEDYTNEANDDGWNSMLELSAFLLGVDTLTLTIWIVWQGTKMINLVKILENIGQIHSAGSSSSRKSAYLKKVEDLVAHSKRAVIILVLMITIFPIIYFSTKYIPFNYIFYYSSIAVVPISAGKNMNYASISSENGKTNSNQHSDGKQTSNPSSKNSQQQQQIIIPTTMQEPKSGYEDAKTSIIIPNSDE